MKLVSKTLVYYLLISFPLLIVAGICSYFLIRGELNEGADESLLKEKWSAEQLISSFKKPQSVFLDYDSLSTIRMANQVKPGTRFTDTLIYDKHEKEYVPYRVLRSSYSFNNTNYQVTLYKTTIEEEELMEGLLSGFALIFLFLILAFFIVNLMLTKVIWKPFYNSLAELNRFDVKQHRKHMFPPSTVLEFDQLNRALNKMTDKIQLDFKQQKEFIENASHEMQTPLAVIKANVSLLTQSQNMKEEEMDQLQVIDNTTKRLAALNKALILLSKIENNQFEKLETIKLNEIVQKVLDNFSEQIQVKRLELELDFQNELSVCMNDALADILISNLLQNAIRYTKPGGRIKINVLGNIFSISNSGEQLPFDSNDLFMRFKKSTNSKDSLGLGLSIVKSIVSYYNYSVSYAYYDHTHMFKLIV
ncbi:MAG TPA: HAMP domain-containing sensor histidine kinase [Bacteroidia bacterium]|nr:HAMP domain-containing sensor histidine kinase [Bacteroidia bacterium]